MRPVPAVAVVPLAQIRKRAQAVDARVRPEVDQDHAPAQVGERLGAGVEPARDAAELRGRAVVLEHALAAPGCLGRAGAGQLTQLALCSRRALEPVLQRLGVAGNPGLEVLVDPERHRERGGADEHACRATDGDRVRAEGSRGPLAGERDREHGQGRAGRVGQREQHAFEADLAVGGDHADGGEHGSRAGDEDEPEAGAEEEAAAEVARAAACERLQRAGDELAHLRHEQRQRDEEEERDREVPQQVLRQSEPVEQPGREEREDGEADDDARDDRERPPPGRAAREHDRQHRQDAGRERRDDPGDEADREQDQHSEKR